jgi:hypothetical protein
MCEIDDIAHTIPDALSKGDLFSAFGREANMNWRRALYALVAFASLGGPATAGIWQFTEEFESPSPSGWFTGGGSGFDFDRGLAHSGRGNAWVRFTQGWNSVNRWVPSVPHNANCTAQAFIRVSSAVTDGYFSVRGGSGGEPSAVINEVKLIGPWTAPQNVDYRKYTFDFNSGNFPQLLVYFGLWGNGQDGWMQIDDLAISCPTPF